MTVRAASEAARSGIQAISNDVIRTSTAVHADDPVPLADRAAWFAEQQAQGYPVPAVDDTAAFDMPRAMALGADWCNAARRSRSALAGVFPPQDFGAWDALLLRPPFALAGRRTPGREG